MRNDHAPTRMNCHMLCDDCAFPDTCAADDACTRARLARLNFEAAGSANAPSAIIEPPTKAELAGVALNQDAACPEWDRFIARVFSDPDQRAYVKRVCGEIENVQSAEAPIPQIFSRAQIRAAIDEISKAQLQIVPALEICGAEVDAVEADRRERTAANVLEALPEAVAHQFGLTIRGACSFCHTTIFTADPKATDAEGRDVCEAHA